MIGSNKRYYEVVTIKCVCGRVRFDAKHDYCADWNDRDFPENEKTKFIMISTNTSHEKYLSTIIGKL